jgi:hypothetical protein
MSYLFKIAAFVIFGSFFFINILTLKDGHNWGDDFAQYIQHAVNLVEHKPYASDISLDLRVVCPPGFPLLLSSVIYWSGVNFKVLKSLNIVFWAIGGLVTFALAKRRLDLFGASVITLWFLTSPLFFFFKQNILSDIPFMCFVLLSIWTFMKFEECQFKGSKDSSRLFLLLSIFCMSYSFLIRYAGVSLFLAVLLYNFINKRDWRVSLGFILGLALSWSIALRFSSSAMGYFDRTTVSLFHDWIWICWSNLTYSLDNILGLYISDQDLFSNILAPSAAALFNDLITLLLLGNMGAFFYQLYQRKISIMGCFTLIYLMGIIFWPVHAGLRYLLPVMVPVTIYLITCIRPVWQKFAVLIFIFLILQNMFIIAAHFNFNDDDIYKREPLEMFQWVERHVKPGEAYMFSKPRVLGLLTHRIGHNFGTYPQDMSDWPKRIKPLRIKYLITDKGFERYTPYNNFCLRVDNYELYINLIWKNKMFKVFKVTLPADD